MSNVTVVSTTETPEQVNAAAEAMESDTLVQAAEEGTGGEGRSSFEATEGWTDRTGARVASTTDDPADIAEVQKDLDEDREVKKEEYLGMGRTRRRMAQTISRLHEKIDSLEKRLETENPPANGEAPPQQTEQGNGEAQQQPTQQQQLQQQYAQEMRVLEAQLTAPYREQLARARYPDFAEALENVEVPQWVINELMTHRDGYDVAYAIARDRQYQQAIMDAHHRADQRSAQDIYAILNEISGGLRFNARRGDAQPRRPATRTATPAPIEPVKGGSSTSHRALDDPAVSYQEFKRRREEQEGRRR